MNNQKCTKEVFLENQESILAFFNENQSSAMEAIAYHLLDCNSCFRSLLEKINYFIDKKHDDLVLDSILNIRKDKQTPIVKITKKILDTRMEEVHHRTKADVQRVWENIWNVISKEPPFSKETIGEALVFEGTWKESVNERTPCVEVDENILMNVAGEKGAKFQNKEQLNEEIRKGAKLGNLLQRVFASPLLLKTEANSVFEMLSTPKVGGTLSQIVDELLGYELFRKEKTLSPFDWLRSVKYPLEGRAGKWVDMSSERWVNLSVERQIRYAKAYQQWYAWKKGETVEKRFPLGKSQMEIEMVLIPPGKFWMGSPENETDRVSNETRHKVLISQAFWCGKYPVTQEEYECVTGKNPSNFKGKRRPVEYVSWNESNEFCQKIGMNLLSEAQWEYACRAGTTSKYYFGEYEKELELCAWFDKNSANKTHDVGEKKENAFELKDMIGNVWEWCTDYWKGALGKEETEDPVNLSASSGRVGRGGGWDGSAVGCRSAGRGGSGPSFRSNNLGLRVAGSL